MPDDKPKGFFAKVARFFEDGIVVADLEANLYPPGTTRGRNEPGEIEYKAFKTGRAVLEIEVSSRMKIPEGDELVVRIHGVEVTRVNAGHYRTDIKLSTEDGHELPPIKAGDPAEILHNGEVILQGVFKHD